MSNEEAKEVPQDTSAFWFEEEVTESVAIRMKMDRIMFSGRSKFQKIQVIETQAFGKTLVLDSKTQSALGDEFIYHESLVHPVMLAHGNPKSVFIGGGGELATAREILRHKSVEKVVMVDIDEEVVSISRKELPEWSDGAFEDPRLEVHYEDAYGFLENCKEQFDVVIFDIADPIELGPGVPLYTQEFYQNVVTPKIAPGGLFVTQSGCADNITLLECFTTINRTLASAFDNVVPYLSDIPSFGTVWGFNLAWNGKLADEKEQDFLNKDVALVDKQIAERLTKLDTKPLRHYDGVAHRGMFGTPKYVRQAIASEKRIMTLANPVFMH
eukprot:TRINITY_DN31945_c0_g1_i1.p2 TRINITY_DN31945_c0_g1~~TRINITY_DN31945_c0_g1_i1.p2  ORF type:complete len:327 (-),score=192.50 TRINITY_DN31945_c0_g1_i1:127-1107(-)